MDKNRYQEISQRNKKDGKLNKLMLCYEVFQEESKTKLQYQEFLNIFPQWIMQMNIEVVFKTGDMDKSVEDGLDKIVKYLDEKYG